MRSSIRFETDKGTVILYKNFTWEYLENEPVMMSIEEDSTGIFSKQWINEPDFCLQAATGFDKGYLLMLADSAQSFSHAIYGHLFRGFTYTTRRPRIQAQQGRYGRQFHRT